MNNVSNQFFQNEITFIHWSTLPCFCFHWKTSSWMCFWVSYLQVAMRSFVSCLGLICSILYTLIYDIYSCISQIREKRCWKCWWTHGPLKLRPFCSVLDHFQRNARRRWSEQLLLQTLASVAVLWYGKEKFMMPCHYRYHWSYRILSLHIKELVQVEHFMHSTPIL